MGSIIGRRQRKKLLSSDRSSAVARMSIPADLKAERPEGPAINLFALTNGYPSFATKSHCLLRQPAIFSAILR
jgi:hypothetical protein